MEKSMQIITVVLILLVNLLSGCYSYLTKRLKYLLNFKIPDKLKTYHIYLHMGSYNTFLLQLAV